MEVKHFSEKYWLLYPELIYSLLLLLAIALLPFTAFANHDLSEITVLVTDGDSGEPLIGVSVYTDNHKFVAFTDYEGKVKIGDLDHRENVNFSYVGYSPLVLPYYMIRKMDGRVNLYAATTLDSIVVVGRRDDPVEEIPFIVDRISAKEIAFKNPQTTADALGASANVFIQKSQMGGGSPIIRGFEANKVLLVLDGVRMNNAIYRSGHLQNSITVDNSILNQIEVIYGPGSLMYGSDALGGVVHFRTKDPKVLHGMGADDTRMIAGAYTRFGSANNEKTLHLDLDYRSQDWGTFTSITYADYGDMRAGGNRPAGYPQIGRRDYFQSRVEQDMIFGPVEDPNILRGSGYNQIDLLQKVRYQPSDSLYFVLNVQYSTSSNITRYDTVTDTLASADELKWAEYYYGPQKRLLASLKTRILKPKAFYDKATIIGAFQRIDEDRLQRKYEESHRQFNLEDVYVFSATADFDKELNKSGRSVISYGIDASYNRVQSEAGIINMKTGAVSRGRVYTRYPSDFSSMTSYAGYLNYNLKSRDSTINFNMGLRYSNVSLKAKYDSTDLSIIAWPTSYIDPGINIKNDDFTWGAGVTFNSKDKWQLRVLASTAFRSPNIDDFAKIRVKNSKAILPNPDLRPEKSFNGEVTVGKEFGRIRNKQGVSLHLSGTGFYTHLTDVIVRRDGKHPDGGNTIEIPTQGNFDVQQNFNETFANVYGFSGNLGFKINDNWEFRTSINYTKGESQFVYTPKVGEVGPVIDTLVPLSHIPPLYGRSSLLFKAGKFRVEGVVQFTGRKPIEDYAVASAKMSDDGQLILDREGTSDNPEYTPFTLGPNGEINYIGSLAWTTYNIYSSYKFNDRISIDLAMENLTDLHYIPFSSGLSAAGRNYIITLRGKF